MAAPIPRAPPVTNATLPSRCHPTLFISETIGLVYTGGVTDADLERRRLTGGKLADDAPPRRVVDVRPAVRNGRAPPGAPLG